MKICTISGHSYGRGGGFQTVKHFLNAFVDLGHEVDYYTRGNMPMEILSQWNDRVPIRFYSPGVESQYDVALGIDHFAWFQPLAKKNYAFVFFPQDNLPPPPEGVKIFSVSNYAASYIKDKWGIDAETIYLPIGQEFHSGDKERIILHASRFSEPSMYADKGQRQMIQAFKSIAGRIPGWRLVLCGSVDPMQDYYFAELARLAYGYQIDFKPNLSQGALVDLFSRASIYWHATGVSLQNIPGAQEHLGITPLEAQASGCVPIVYNSGGMPEVVVANRTGLLFENVMELPAMTLELIKRMKDWSALSQAGQFWGREWQNFEAFVGRVDDMLNDRSISKMNPFILSLKYAPSDVTIVIPTYNSPHLQGLLDSLSKTAKQARILVVNNGESLQNLRVDNNVAVVDTGENLGFAGAHKFAEKLVSTPLVLMMNDDMTADNEGWLEQLLHVMNGDGVGVVGPKLLFPDGRLQFAGGVIDWNSKDIGHHKNYGGLDSVEFSTPQEVDFITGAALLCRRELYTIPEEMIGALNFEDVWMCFNAREKGFKVVYQPAASLVHYESETKIRTENVSDKIEKNKMELKKRWMNAI